MKKLLEMKGKYECVCQRVPECYPSSSNLGSISGQLCCCFALLSQFMYQSIPKPPIPPRAIPGHLTRVKIHTVGNLTQNEARPVRHLTFVSKRLSAVGNKRICNSLIQHMNRVHGSLLLLIGRFWN